MLLSSTDPLAAWAVRNLSPEVQAVLRCAGAADDAGYDPGDGVDWDRLVALSISEGANPVLAHRLLLGARGVPARVRVTLEHLARATEIRQAYLRRRMYDVFDALRGVEVPILLLKGAAMAASTYGSFSRRPMSDIDVMIAPEHIGVALATVSGTGWARRFGSAYDPLYATMHHVQPLLDVQAPRLSIGLELHTHIVPPHANPYRLAAEHLWAAATTCPGLPAHVRIPAIHHRLLHCCIHFAWSHQLRSGTWRAFRDVSAIARDPAIEWSTFVDAARRSGAHGACYWTLRLARALSAAVVPEDVLEQMRPSLPRALVELFARHLSAALFESERLCPSERLRRFIWARTIAASHHDRWHVTDALSVHHGALPRPDGGHAAARSPRTALSVGAWTRYFEVVVRGRVGPAPTPRAEEEANRVELAG